MAAAGVEPQDASAITRALNRAVLDALPFADTRYFDDARPRAAPGPPGS